MKFISENILRLVVHTLLVLLFLLVVLSTYKHNSLSSTQTQEVQKVQEVKEVKEVKEPPKPQIKICTHKGGSKVNYNHLQETVTAVLAPFKIVKESRDLEKLVYETMIVETRLGESHYGYASKNYRNYGIAQIRVETAKDLKEYLKRVSSEDYNRLISLYDQSKSEKENLLYNVPYSIAVCGLYYICRDANIFQKIYTVADRAKAWKKYYNTYKGAGTPEVYLKRVKEFS